MSLTSFIKEKLIINKDIKKAYTCFPANRQELFDELKKRLNEYGGGTEKEPLNLNDIDISAIEDLHSLFYYLNDPGVKLVAIDISGWDVSNVVDFHSMFYDCHNLKYIGDISGWEINNASDLHLMFADCKKLRNVGDLSNWADKVNNVNDFTAMFRGCEKMEKQDLESWKVKQGLTKANVKMMISGTTGWKLPAWVKKLPKN